MFPSYTTWPYFARDLSSRLEEDSDDCFFLTPQVSSLKSQVSSLLAARTGIEPASAVRQTAILPTRRTSLLKQARGYRLEDEEYEFDTHTRWTQVSSLKPLASQ